MSDSGKTFGQCSHDREPWWCRECLQERVRRLDAEIAKRDNEQAARLRWYVDRVAELDAENVRLQESIRTHRDQRGDDRCWMDDEQLYAVLPEGYTPPERDTAVELERCQQYIACRRNPRTVYVSPQRRIDELEVEVATLRAALEDRRQCT